MSLGDLAVTREILGNVPRGLAVAFYVGAALATLAAAWGFGRQLAGIRRGRRDSTGPARHRSAVARVSTVVAYLTWHRELRRDPYAGIAHLLTVHGFAVLFAGTCLVFLEHDTPLHFFYGRFYQVASLLVDLGGVAFLVGLSMLLGRRHGRGGGGRERLLDRWWVAALGWLLLAVGVSGFLVEGARIAQALPAFERWSVVGYAVAIVLRAAGLAGEPALAWHRALWIAHAGLSLAFLALLPWRFFGHLVWGAASWALRTARPLGQLRQPGAADPGARLWAEFPRVDLLQAQACTTCGRCDDVCPAAAAGKPLRPRDVVLGLREAMAADLPTVPVAADALWSCTTCGACTVACPVGIEVLDKLVELRRGLVEAGQVPGAAERVFEGLLRGANPFERPARERLLWAAGLPVPVARPGEAVDLLYWVGCAGSFDPDGQRVSRAMVRILDQLGIAYRVLGPAERCTGDPARRLGEEGLFRELARHNVATLQAHRVRKVLTHCAHCFNTFRREYPAFGLVVEVEHHSQLLARLAAAGRLGGAAGRGAASGAEVVTFHDPCYLGRANGETAAPRALLDALPGLRPVEMPRSGTASFCCGAGGGAMWLDVPGRARVEGIRAREAAATGAGTVVTGCPFCATMLRAGTESAGEARRLRVKDLAELVAETL